QQQQRASMLMPTSAQNMYPAAPSANPFGMSPYPAATWMAPHCSAQPAQQQWIMTAHGPMLVTLQPPMANPAMMMMPPAPQFMFGGASATLAAPSPSMAMPPGASP